MVEGKYVVMKVSKTRAGNCIKCGKCETVCPQKLSIREDLKKVGEVFCI